VGASDSKQRRRRGSAAEIDRAAVVREQLRRMSKANVDTVKSLEKRLLVFVICMILIDSLFWGLLQKIELGWAGLCYVSPCFCENVNVNSSLFLAVVKL
jgi:hypothetical protein